MSGQLGQTSAEEITLAVEASLNKISLYVSGEGIDEIVSEVSPLFWARLTELATRAPRTCGGPDWLGRPEIERREAVAAVVGYGADLFRQIMPLAEHRELFRKLIQAGSDHPPRICAISDAARIPWEVLCLTPDDEAPAHQDLLGWRHVVVRKTESGARARKAKHRKIVAARVVEDDILSSVGLGRAQEARERYPSVTYPVLEKLEIEPQDYQRFHDFLLSEDERLDLVHFDCHVSFDQDAPANSKVRVTSDFKLPVREFGYDKLVVAHLPLVVFNGCDGGTVGPGQLLSIARRLREAGAASVVAAECEIGDDFCVAFAETFYSVAASAIDVGSALLETRRRLLGHDLNPLGLFYGLYGGADLEIEIDTVMTPTPGSPLANRLAWIEEAA